MRCDFQNARRQLVANLVTLIVIMMNWRNGRDIGTTITSTAAPDWGVSTNGVGLVWTMQYSPNSAVRTGRGL